MVILRLEKDAGFLYCLDWPRRMGRPKGEYMSHKTIARIAVIMIIVFGGVVILYPMLFHSEPATIPDAGAVPGTLPSSQTTQPLSK